MHVTRRRRGTRRAEEVVLVTDGAEWIWELVEERFLEAVQTVDRYHAAECTWKVGDAIYGVIQALRAHSDPDLEEDPARRAITYFRDDRERALCTSAASGMTSVTSVDHRDVPTPVA